MPDGPLIKPVHVSADDYPNLIIPKLSDVTGSESPSDILLDYSHFLASLSCRLKPESKISERANGLTNGIQILLPLNCMFDVKRVLKTEQSPLSSEIAPGKLLTFDFRGDWIGAYKGHFDQHISVMQWGDILVGLKITGDDHVPGGVPSFICRISDGKGQGLVSEKEFRNPALVPGSMKLIRHNNDKVKELEFIWENCGRVVFRPDYHLDTPRIVSK